MNPKITLAALILSALSIPALADANHTYPSANVPALTTLSPAPNSTADTNTQPRQLGKTRAQVYQELIEARRQGIIPTPEYDYPPSQRTIDSNKARNQIIERYWASQNSNN